jgi:hypothetical protein
MLGKVDLPPAFGPAQLSDAPPIAAQISFAMRP